MAMIFETKNFVVEAADRPHVSREEGGHIKILPKKKIVDRTELTPAQAKEVMRLTMIVGEAMATALNKRGIDVARINYQDMGNWNATFHIHVYGRAKSAKVQKFGEAVLLPRRETGFYDGFEPLNEGDIREIRKQVGIVIKEEKFRDGNWGL